MTVEQIKEMAAEMRRLAAELQAFRAKWEPEIAKDTYGSALARLSEEERAEIDAASDAFCGAVEAL